MKKWVYEITKDDYLHIIEYPLRRKAALPRAKRKRFFLTWGQTGVVAMAILLVEMPLRNKLVLAGLSLLLTVMTAAYGSAYRFKAKFLLSGLLQMGQLPPDYFGRHTLCRDGDEITVSYGNSGEREAVANISYVASDDAFVYLCRHSGSIFEAIPLGAAGSCEAVMEEFLPDLRDSMAD